MRSAQHPPDHIRALAEQALRGRAGCLSLHDFSRLAGISVTLIQLRLGPWRKFKADLGYSTGPIHTPEKLLGLLQHLVAQHGPDITQSHFTIATGLNEKAVTRTFGSWADFRVAAGLPRSPKTRKRTPPEAFYADIFRVAIQINRKVTRSDYHRLGNADLDVLEDHLGPWPRVLKGYLRFIQQLDTSFPEDAPEASLHDHLRQLLARLPRRRRPCTWASFFSSRRRPHN